MPLQIHGNTYVTVAERVTESHEKNEELSITTEILKDIPVVIKATVTTKKGVFTGISAANPDKAIEKMNPYEVAETSAVGRALGFAGYGSVDSIASADEINKGGYDTPNKIKTDIKCPICNGEMWDNTKNKLNPKAPDYKCKDKNCKGVIWPSKDKFEHYDAEGNGLTEEQYKKYTEGTDEIDINDIQF